MQTYRKTFDCSEQFPVSRGDTWVVRERGKAVEHWTVISAGRKQFTAHIAEFSPPDND